MSELPNRSIYARITISAEAIAAAVARDRALTRRMASVGLTPKLAKKAWRRIQSRRMYELYASELAAVAADINARLPALVPVV